MITAILTAIAAYISTSVDEIPILFMLYTKKRSRGSARTITFSYFFGTLILISLGLLGAFGLGFIPQKWMMGIFGLVPLIMGIKAMITGDGDEEEGAEKAMQKYGSLGIQVLAVTFALGADDFGVYAPLFASLAGWEILVMIVVFILCTALLCLVSYKLTSIKPLSEFMEKYERWIIGILFSAIGIFILQECGTIAHFMAYMRN